MQVFCVKITWTVTQTLALIVIVARGSYSVYRRYRRHPDLLLPLLRPSTEGVDGSLLGEKA